MTQNDFSKVIIWGHKLHTNTYSYVQWGFYRGFKHLGYNTYWYDDNDNVSGIDFSNCLFVTEHQVDKKIPKNTTSYYVLHNCDRSTYTHIVPENHILLIQVYTVTMHKDAIPIKNSKYECYLPPPHNIVFAPWATDLLPHEITDVISKLDDIEKNESKNQVNFIGMILDHWHVFGDECRRNRINFTSCGGFSNTNVSTEKNMELIQNHI